MVASVLDTLEMRAMMRSLERARDEIRILEARVAELSKVQPVLGITGAHGALTTPLEFARLHRVSVSTVNRALNAQDLLGVRQPNRRWLVYADQPYHAKRKRG